MSAPPPQQPTRPAHFPGDGESRIGLPFLLWTLLLTATCLWPIWAQRFLPMQDYPQHLFITKVLATFGDPALDWPRHYTVHLASGAYILSYGLMRALALGLGVEIAGKLSISLYVILMAVVVLRAARHAPSPAPPWPLLLVFPLLFHQCYFLGFQSYLLSLPLLLLALFALADVGAGPLSPRLGAKLALSVGLLLLAHPYTVLVFLALGGLLALAAWPDRAALLRTLLPVLAVAALFGLWSLLGHGVAGADKLEWAVRWWPPAGILAFLFAMFTGLRWQHGFAWPELPLWLTALGLIAFHARRTALPWRFSRPALLLFAATLLGFAALPFWLGYYSYFNLRLAPIAYFLGVLALAAVPLPRASGHALGLVAWLLVALSAQAQARIGDETATILPVLEKMAPNSAVLPVLVDSRTRVLDSTLFYQLHAHEAYYYHVIRGGGVNPLPFPNPMMPVQLRADAPWPLLESTPVPEWPRALAPYRYVLVRGRDGALLRLLTQLADVTATSGPWTLLEVRRP